MEGTTDTIMMVQKSSPCKALLGLRWSSICDHALSLETVFVMRLHFQRTHQVLSVHRSRVYKIKTTKGEGNGYIFFFLGGGGGGGGGY